VGHSHLANRHINATTERRLREADSAAQGVETSRNAGLKDAPIYVCAAPANEQTYWSFAPEQMFFATNLRGRRHVRLLGEDGKIEL
jgi:hypothetical protein